MILSICSLANVCKIPTKSGSLAFVATAPLPAPLPASGGCMGVVVVSVLVVYVVATLADLVD